MTYEFLMAVALLCQHSASITTGERKTEYRDTKTNQGECQQALIKCAGETPTPMSLVKCVRDGTTK